VPERSLEIGVEGGDEYRKPGCIYFGERFGKVYPVCILMNLS